jgi:hypothetical protein
LLRAVVAERTLADRANEYFKQASVH